MSTSTNKISLAMFQFRFPSDSKFPSCLQERPNEHAGIISKPKINRRGVEVLNIREPTSLRHFGTDLLNLRFRLVSAFFQPRRDPHSNEEIKIVRFTFVPEDILRESNDTFVRNKIQAEVCFLNFVSDFYWEIVLHENEATYNQIGDRTHFWCLDAFPIRVSRRDSPDHYLFLHKKRPCLEDQESFNKRTRK